MYVMPVLNCFFSDLGYLNIIITSARDNSCWVQAYLLSALPLDSLRAHTHLGRSPNI